jgi:hypothetical protein
MLYALVIFEIACVGLIAAWEFFSRLLWGFSE